MAVLAAGAAGLLGRAGYLQMGQGEFLLDQAAARHVRTVASPALRGVIRDRRGTELALSAAIESIWANPREIVGARARWSELAAAAGLDPSRFERHLDERADRSFVYVRRHVEPATAARVRALDLPGVYFEREFRRYYPEAEVAAHLVGFTGIDGEGKEGMERVWDASLRGVAGSKQVIQDRKGRSIEDVRNVRAAEAGRDVHLTIDLRLQSLAYRALKTAVRRNDALGGSVVVVDARTGDVHALVNQPGYNPNNPAQRTGSAIRNRAATDMFEPGSTVKPFAVAAALDSGAVRPDQVIDTSPGRLRVGRHWIRDRRDLGILDVASVIKQSSNVGVTRITLATSPERLREVFEGIGFGSVSGTGFVGESAGRFEPSRRFREHERATLSYGYGLAVTALQLARAYTIFANEGARLDLRLVRSSEAGGGPHADPHPVISPTTARTVLAMLEEVVEAKDGTGRRARVPGYRVAGKTGTSRKATVGGYRERKYVASFAGLAPASAPRFVVAVVVDEPRGKEYYGGLVAAPVFQQVMSDALRLNAVPPDSLRTPLRKAEEENYDYAMVRDPPGGGGW